MSKLIIAAVGFLNICLLSQDLQADTSPNATVTVLRYGFLFILNSKLVCDLLFKSTGCESLIFFWAIFYLVCLILNTIMISSTNYLMPVTSGTATNFVIYQLGLDQQRSQMTTGFLISAGLICIVIIFHVIMMISEDPVEVHHQRLLPMCYIREPIQGLARDCPPRYTSTENIPVPPNCNTALLHAAPIATPTRT